MSTCCFDLLPWESNNIFFNAKRVKWGCNIKVPDANRIICIFAPGNLNVKQHSIRRKLLLNDGQSSPHFYLQYGVFLQSEPVRHL